MNNLDVQNSNCFSRQSIRAIKRHPHVLTWHLRRTALALIVAMLETAGCSGGVSVPLDLQTLDREADQWRIASYYSQQAMQMRQIAQDLRNRADRYAQLFGQDSEWVTSSRLLAEYYEETAQQMDDLAQTHMSLVPHRVLPRTTRSPSPESPLP